jgi:hydrogenase maturation protease
MEAQRKIAVLGLGNVLMGDDGLGPYVAAVLSASYEFGPGVSVLDAGTPGLDLIPYISGLDVLILVDTVRAGGSPGELRLYRREQILAMPAGPRLTPHDPGFKEALQALEFEGTAPREVLLVGVIPEHVARGVELSGAVREAVPKVEAEVLRELERLGKHACRRARPLTPDLWWVSPCTS